MQNIQQAILEELSQHNLHQANGTTSLSARLIDSYSCLNCKETKTRMDLRALGRPFRPLPVCSCRKRRFERERRDIELSNRRDKIKSLYGDGLIDEELKRASFENFETRPGTEKAYQLAKRFVSNFDNQSFGLYMFGAVGTGKSHLAAAIHKELLKGGYSSVYIDVTQLFGLAKSSFKSKSKKTDQDYIQAAIKCDLLTLDEIGLAALTDYEFKMLFQILNGRKGKVTNFTSNLDLNRLENWLNMDKYGNALVPDGRVFDRILGSSQPVQVVAESYRKYKAMQRMGAV